MPEPVVGVGFITPLQYDPTRSETVKQLLLYLDRLILPDVAFLIASGEDEFARELAYLRDNLGLVSGDGIVSPNRVGGG